MLDDYLIGFRMRFSTNSYTTDCINLEIGIAMGCTIFPILFVMAMEVILKAAEDSTGPANLGGGCYMPPLRAFMDDTTIICSNEDETRRMLQRLNVLIQPASSSSIIQLNEFYKTAGGLPRQAVSDGRYPADFYNGNSDSLRWLNGPIYPAAGGQGSPALQTVNNMAEIRIQPTAPALKAGACHYVTPPHHYTGKRRFIHSFREKNP
ncbi:hypothetical protein RRG08_036309 [Elysia crispata]|uniref:Reverse transcriptase domain-containing protein n=1 Tax=Elysia crispata TaxID=231223 RepID=A0AAE0ZPB7_9GAST|nr:hypothetical protein RRG08_036309 [Elysia crispata]